MSSYTVKALAAVIVVVSVAEVTRGARSEWNKAHPKETPKDVTAMRPVLGGFSLGVFLFAVGMVSESVGSLFCLLVVVGALLKDGNGAALFTALNPIK